MTSQNQNVRYELITPSQAAKYLLSNTKNRKLGKGRVRKMAEDMKAGRWLWNGDPIRFSSEGVLMDGQHRLTACVEAGVSFSAVVVRDLDPKALMTIDTGRGRTSGDVLAILGHGDAARLASALKVFYGLSVNYPIAIINKSYNRLSNTQVAELADRVPTMPAALKVTRVKAFRALRRGPESVYSALVEATRQADLQKAEVFWGQVTTGLGLEVDDPAFRLRHKMLLNHNTRMSPQHWEWAGWTIAAWNAFYEGRKLSRLQVRNRSLQEIRGFDPPDLSDI